MPAAAPALRPAFDGSAADRLHAWASVRCTASDRLPIVGPVAPARLPGLWVHRHGRPRADPCRAVRRIAGGPPARGTLPLDARLARAMGTERLGPHTGRNKLIRI